MNTIDHIKNLYKIETIEQQLQYWIDNLFPEIKNTYLEKKGYSVYVRSALRSMKGKWYITLDIARIEIPKKDRGKGWFTNFLKTAFIIQPWDGLFIESVLNKRLAARLRKDNWTEIPGISKGASSCFYKLISCGGPYEKKLKEWDTKS